jgi:hypothetical protein
MTRLADNIDDLQQAAIYLTIRNRLRPFGIGGLIFGSLAIMAGSAPPEQAEPDRFIVLLGLALLAIGLWVISAPSYRSLLAVGAVVVCVGSLNIRDALANHSSSFWMILGAFQLFWATQCFAQYIHFSKMKPRKPSDDAIRYVQDLYKEVWNSRPAQGYCVIEFKAKGQTGRAWLMEDSIVMVLSKGQTITIAPKDEVEITPEGQLNDKMAKVKMRIGAAKMPVAISHEQVSMFQDWKTAPDPAFTDPLR